MQRIERSARCKRGAKRAAAIKGFSEVAAKYPSANEGAVAKYYLGAIAADQGKMADA